MKKAIVRNTILVALIALVVLFICSMLLVNFAVRKSATENVIKLNELFANQVSKGDIDIPEEINIDTRVTVVDRSGRVVFDNMQDKELMDNHLNREEILSAEQGKGGAVSRYSATLNKQMLYYASKVTLSGGEYVYVRVAIPLLNLNNITVTALVILLLVMAIVVVAVNMLSSKLTKSMLQPISGIMNHLQQVNAEGFTKLPTSKYSEVNEVIGGINEVTSKLNDGIIQLEREKEKFQYVLDGINQAIVAINSNNEVVFFNNYSAGVFDITDKVLGKSIKYLTDNTDIISKFVYNLGTQEFRTSIFGRTYKARADKLRNSRLQVLILADITEEVNLANIKSSFFDNASHELKTPITSIKGFTELMNGDKALSVESKKYLDIMTKDINRLLNIIEDMLQLSRLENSSEDKIKEDIDVFALVEEVASGFTSQLKLSNIALTCVGSMNINFNRQDMCEMVGNLIDNAIKYNKMNGTIEILLSANTLKVKDSGIGIDRKYLPRIFERFYRVDKGRSRNSGGTGLGLAIVKHIAISNNADISVQSKLAVGTTFTVVFHNN